MSRIQNAFFITGLIGIDCARQNSSKPSEVIDMK